MSVDSQKKELNAFFSFFATFDLARPVTTIADLSDGAALFEILSIVCVFRLTESGALGLTAAAAPLLP